MIAVGVVVLIVGGFWFYNSSKPPIEEGQLPAENSQMTMPTNTQMSTEMTQNEGETMIMASNFKFEPAEIRAKVGETVKVRLANTQGTHNFTVDDLNVASETIQQGNDTLVELTPNKAGEFEYYCSVGNHQAQGMVGKLIVEE